MNQTDTQKPPQEELVPLFLIRAMFGLVLVILAIVTWAKVTDQPIASTPPPGEILAEREIVIDSTMGGAATIRAVDGSLIAELSPEQGGFIAGVARVIARERSRAGVAPDAPVTLIRKDTGRISIHDPSTGWQADLMGFGVDNARAFARLLAM